MIISRWCHCGRVLRLLRPLLIAILTFGWVQESARADGYGASQPETASPHEQWCGMYLSGQKVGHSQVKVEATTFRGKPALKETTHSNIKLTLLGMTVEEAEDSVSFTDLKSQPITETIDVVSNGSKLHLTAEYDYVARKVYCVLGTGADTSKKTLDIPAGANLAGDVDFATAGHKLATGDKFDIYTLDPTQIILEPIHIEITGRAEIPDESGVKIPVSVAHETMSSQDITEWIDASGDALKGELQIGPVQLVVTAESKAHATDPVFISPAVTAKGSPAYSPSSDLAEITSVAVNRPIQDPRKLKTLHAVMSGIPDRRLILSDLRQNESTTGSDKPPLSVDITVNVEQRAKPLKLPISEPAVAVYLRKAPYLNTDDPELRKTALRLRGSETDAYKVARSIRDWVHQMMTPDASIGVPRSASDVYARKRGVCRDYATLYTALARIAGVPTRLCGGIVYADMDGHAAFYYHAWAESYVSDGQWVAVDPTLYDPSLGIDYVDATHIKFAEGDVTQMYDAISVVGKLKITIQ